MKESWLYLIKSLCCFSIYYIFHCYKQKKPSSESTSIKKCERMKNSPDIIIMIIICFILKNYAKMGGLFKWEYRLDLNLKPACWPAKTRLDDKLKPANQFRLVSAVCFLLLFFQQGGLIFHEFPQKEKRETSSHFHLLLFPEIFFTCANICMSIRHIQQRQTAPSFTDIWQIEIWWALEKKMVWPLATLSTTVQCISPSWTTPDIPFYHQGTFRFCMRTGPGHLSSVAGGITCLDKSFKMDHKISLNLFKIIRPISPWLTASCSD